MGVERGMSIPLKKGAGSQDMSLAQIVKTSREKFAAQLGRRFARKQRTSDFRILFTSAVHRHFPTLAVLWLKKHSHLAKILCTTYSPEQLQSMLELYLTPGGMSPRHSNTYYHERGISFDNFYWSAPRLATDLAAREARADRIAERKAQQLALEAALDTQAGVSPPTQIRVVTQAEASSPHLIENDTMAGSKPPAPPRRSEITPDLATFKQSAFFRRLPKLFQEKIDGQSEADAL